MRAVVTGGAGLIGMNLVERLRKEHDVSSIYHVKKPGIIYDNVIYLKADFTVPIEILSSVEQVLQKSDVLFVCAAEVTGAKHMQSKDLVTNNSIITLNLLKAAYEAGVKKVIYYGSTTSYPEGDEPMTEDRLFEGDPYDKYFAVGWVKRCGIKLCEYYKRSGMDITVLIPSNIYGPHDKFDPEYSHVTSALIKKVVERRNPLEVWGDGSEIRDLLYVDDVVEASIQAIDWDFGPYNIGLGASASVSEVLAIICHLEDFRPIFNYDYTKPTMIPVRRVDISKVSDKWKPIVGLKTGLQRTIDWYKENL